MKPLIDGDILLHEIGWSSQFKDKDTGEEILFDFDYVRELLDRKIALICDEVEATEAPTIFITDSPWLNERVNKERKWQGLEPLEYVPGFRYEIAKTKPYKGQRKNPKPFHFYNIIAYLRSEYDVVIAREGLEADDLICATQFRRKDGGAPTVICSRDKDLRICPGWHYSWECGGQASIGPEYTDDIGWLEGNIGYGKAFFYYQMLVGDSADNIPGLEGVGPARAKKLLEGCTTERDYFQAVKKAYKEKLGEESKTFFMEQANLLWMRMGGPYEIPSYQKG